MNSVIYSACLAVSFCSSAIGRPELQPFGYAAAFAALTANGVLGRATRGDYVAVVVLALLGRIYSGQPVSIEEVLILAAGVGIGILSAWIFRTIFAGKTV